MTDVRVTCSSSRSATSCSCSFLTRVSSSVLMCDTFVVPRLAFPRFIPPSMVRFELPIDSDEKHLHRVGSFAHRHTDRTDEKRIPHDIVQSTESFKVNAPFTFEFRDNCTGGFENEEDIHRR